MSAFLVSLALLAMFAIFGLAFLATFPPRIRFVQQALIAPTIGLSVWVMPVFALNRFGLPVKQFGAWLTLGLLVCALLILVVRRPVLPLRRLLPYLLVLVAGLFLAARPMFSYGFDWISFANDDMANYALGAQRFYENGFFAPPDLQRFFRGEDYSHAYWFMHVLTNTRAGSELLLAQVWATTGLNPHQSFMPVIFALHGSLLLACAAMLAGSKRAAPASWLLATLVAVSPMTTLGALYQLIAQVAGLSLLCVGVLLIYRPATRSALPTQVRAAAPAVLVCCAILIFYPEVLPFLGLGWLCYLVACLFHHRPDQNWRLIRMGIVIGVGLLVILNTYLVDAISFMLRQAGGGLTQANAVEVLFPYFLIPSGLPVAWGLMPIAQGTMEPLASLSIFGAIALFVFLLYQLLRQLRQAPSAIASVLLVMLGVGLLLFFRNNDFGLFKLVMFAQPFLLAVLAVSVCAIVGRRTRTGAYTLLAAFVVVNIGVQAAYVQKSTGVFLGSLGELPFASATGMVREFSREHEALPPRHNGPETLDTPHIVLGKLQALYTRGTDVLFPSRQFLVEFIEGEINKIRNESVSNPVVQSYWEEKAKRLRNAEIAVDGDIVRFWQPAITDDATALLELVPGALDVFNLYDAPDPTKGYFNAPSRAKDKVNFVNSNLGQHYYLGTAGHIAHYALENDPMFPGRRFMALGRYLVFEVQSGDSMPRMVVELTSTLTKQFGSALPNSHVQALALGLVGRGSARVVSPPLPLHHINGRKYAVLDIGRAPAPMQEDKKGLQLAFGRDIRLDRRLISTFGRDVSLVSEADYRAWTPPTALSRFPGDLLSAGLEYAGIYEDGWISERAFFVLSGSPDTRGLIIKGSIPQIKDPAFGATLSIALDGREIASRKLGLGPFEISVPVPGLHGKARVDLTFSASQQLPGADGRITGAKIDYIGFQ